MVGASAHLASIASVVAENGDELKPYLALDLGRRNYPDSLVFQNLVVEHRKRKEIPDCLIFVNYSHLITLGRAGNIQHLLASRPRLEEYGIGFFVTDRGGDITYHGPGQFIVYPVLDLKEWHRDIGRYLRSLEHCVIETLADFGVLGQSIPGLTGVWVGDKKIAALGIRTSQWVTSHGLALNVHPDLTHFDLIVPCGLKSKGVTSMLEILGTRADMSEIKTRFCVHFSKIFERNLTLWSSLN